jgi:hypothetical protein
MKDEASPITPDEWMLRLIWIDFYKPELAISIRDRAFTPRANESEGISMFRLACVNSPEDVLAVIAPEKREKYILASLSVAEIIGLGLTVQPSKITGVAGHIVIPELSIEFLKSEGGECQMLQKKLAQIAAKNLILPSDSQP